MTLRPTVAPVQPLLKPTRDRVTAQAPTTYPTKQARGGLGGRTNNIPSKLQDLMIKLRSKSISEDKYKILYKNLVNDITNKSAMLKRTKGTTTDSRDYDREINISRGILAEMEELDKKKKKKKKVIQENTYDTHIQNPKSPRVGFLTHKNYLKNPFDNFKLDSNMENTGYRNLMKQIGTPNEIVNAQRHRMIYSDDPTFNLKKTDVKYNYKRIQ